MKTQTLIIAGILIFILLFAAGFKLIPGNIVDSSGSLKPRTDQQIVSLDLIKDKLIYEGQVGQSGSDCEGAAGLIVLSTANIDTYNNFASNFDKKVETYWVSSKTGRFDLPSSTSDLFNTKLADSTAQPPNVAQRYAKDIGYYGYTFSSNFPGGKPEAPCTWNYKITFTGKGQPPASSTPDASKIMNPVSVSPAVGPAASNVGFRIPVISDLIDFLGNIFKGVK